MEQLGAQVLLQIPDCLSVGRLRDAQCGRGTVHPTVVGNGDEVRHLKAGGRRRSPTAPTRPNGPPCARFTERFRSRTRDEWSAAFDGTDACVAPLLTPGEAPSRPHLADRATFAELGGVLQPAPAPRFSRTPALLTRPPAAAGTETREALRDRGIEDVDALLISGAAHQA
ncbi:CoA transferase [Streptomyces sp. NPDC059893]|uniref:CoA transferase n=1 Tax=Streptomyces sp. NPDC059893 TaxID=3346990 RepID=UPI0036513DAC